MGFVNQLRLLLIAVGSLKNGPEFELYHHYKKRLGASFSLLEIKASTPEREAEQILKSIPPQYFILALDERGTSLTSREFSACLEKAQLHYNGIVCIIGGADGLTENLRQQSHQLISFGKMTWPHMLVRAMITEQLYRAVSLMNHHPYHRD